tara:strand:- start:126 stop:287 length:162 start_codon:yes stop_codon:yes gene_type:complete
MIKIIFNKERNRKIIKFTNFLGYKIADFKNLSLYNRQKGDWRLKKVSIMGISK